MRLPSTAFAGVFLAAFVLTMDASGDEVRLAALVPHSGGLARSEGAVALFSGGPGLGGAFQSWGSVTLERSGVGFAYVAAEADLRKNVAVDADLAETADRRRRRGARLGKTGGKVERDDRCAVEVPQGALRREVEITVGPETGRPAAEASARATRLKERRLAAAAEAVEFGPEGTTFDRPVTVALAYDPKEIPPDADENDLKIYHWNPRSGDWEAQDSIVDNAKRLVRAKVSHFSLYQVLVPQSSLGTSGAQVAAGPDSAFRLGEVFTYPNPARGGVSPTFHVEAGIADSVDVRVYDVAGREVYKATISQPPAIKDMGAGPRYAYEHAWDGHIASGVYFYTVEARKSGAGSLRKAGKLGVVR